MAEASPPTVDLEPPRRVGVAEARAAEAGYAARRSTRSRSASCAGLRASQATGWCSGPARSTASSRRPGGRDAGLGDGTVTLARSSCGAALDCPGAFAVELVGRGTRVLGRLAARIERLPAVGETYVIVGWPLGGEGRRQEAGTALLDEAGGVLAVARAVWIEPRVHSRR